MLWALFALLLVVAGMFGWQHWQAREQQQRSLAEQQRTALDARVDTLLQAQRAQAQRLQQAEATNRVLRDELLGIGQRAALLEDSVSKLADPDRHGAQSLRLDEIELLLGIGQQRLRLDDDIDGARRALALPLRCSTAWTTRPTSTCGKRWRRNRRRCRRSARIRASTPMRCWNGSRTASPAVRRRSRRHRCVSPGTSACWDAWSIDSPRHRPGCNNAPIAMPHSPRCRSNSASPAPRWNAATPPVSTTH